MTVRKLTDADVVQLKSVLSEDPVGNMLLLDLLEHEEPGEERQPAPQLPAGYEVLAVGEEMRAVAFVIKSAGMVIPSGQEEACASVGRYLRRRLSIRRMIGRADAVDALWEGYEGTTTSLYRGHVLYELVPSSFRPSDPFAGLETAGVFDLEELLRTSQAMHLEELGVDPLERDAEGFQRGLVSRIQRAAIFVVREQDRIVFKAEVGARCSHGAQLEGVYTVPELRLRGLASRALSNLCQRLLESCPRITLHVGAQNTPAIKTYERLGFRPAGPYRVVVV